MKLWGNLQLGWLRVQGFTRISQWNSWYTIVTGEITPLKTEKGSLLHSFYHWKVGHEVMFLVHFFFF